MTCSAMGSHVRRAMHGFLVEHTEFTLKHCPYGALNHGMGFLTRKGESRVDLQVAPAAAEKGLWQGPMVDACCAWINGHLDANRILLSVPIPMDTPPRWLHGGTR